MNLKYVQNQNMTLSVSAKNWSKHTMIGVINYNYLR